MAQTAIDNAWGVIIKNQEANMPDGKEELGILQTQELVGAVLELGASIKTQSEDGKLSIWEIISNSPKVTKIIKEGRDIDEIMAELKDLKEEELRALNADLITFVFQIIAIVKNLKG